MIRRRVFRAQFVPPPALSVAPTEALRTEVEQLIKGTETQLKFSGFDKPGDVVPVVETARSKQRWVN